MTSQTLDFITKIVNRCSAHFGENNNISKNCLSIRLGCNARNNNTFRLKGGLTHNKIIKKIQKKPVTITFRPIFIKINGDIMSYESILKIKKAKGICKMRITGVSKAIEDFYNLDLKIIKIIDVSFSQKSLIEKTIFSFLPYIQEKELKSLPYLLSEAKGPILKDLNLRYFLSNKQITFIKLLDILTKLVMSRNYIDKKSLKLSDHLKELNLK